MRRGSRSSRSSESLPCQKNEIYWYASKKSRTMHRDRLMKRSRRERPMDGADISFRMASRLVTRDLSNKEGLCAVAFSPERSFNASYALDSLIEQRKRLEEEFQAEVMTMGKKNDPLTEKLEPVPISTTRTNISVKLVALVWSPGT